MGISVSSIQTLLSLLASWQEMKMAGQSQYKSPETPGRRVSDAWTNFLEKRVILFTAVIMTPL